jgi:hypothetical protein
MMMEVTPGESISQAMERFESTHSIVPSTLTDIATEASTNPWPGTLAAKLRNPDYLMVYNDAAVLEEAEEILGVIFFRTIANP